MDSPAPKPNGSSARKTLLRLCATSSIFVVHLVISHQYIIRLFDYQSSRYVGVSTSSSKKRGAVEVFEILCTSENRRVRRWGSYKIRCGEFKRIAEHCTPGVKVTAIQFPSSSFKSKESQLKVYNATISIKRGIPHPHPSLGRVFVDVIDEYKLEAKNLSPNDEILVQNERHGRERFGERKYHVVEHWFNSFPLDMLFGHIIPQFEIPSIREGHSPLRVATIWSAGRNQTCPPLPEFDVSGVSYDCINKAYNIAEWYKEYFSKASFSELDRLAGLLRDPQQGPGRLYFELFWQYDVLVVPVKDVSSEKLRYGNVQRAVSQMRSGVPVLLEVLGEVLEDFVEKYNYTCCFRRGSAYFSARKYWSYSYALNHMKRNEVRKQCQLEGMMIAKDFSPGKIVCRELRILGYDGPFHCS